MMETAAILVIAFVIWGAVGVYAWWLSKQPLE